MLRISLDDFVEAMRLIEAPQLNVAYADTAGNIGYWCTGRVPVRAQGKGDVPVPGWTGEYEWIGEVPFEEMPRALNPQQGYVVTCNHRLVPDDYPHFLGEVWMNGYRARRIVEVFESKGKLSIDDMRALQMDFTCLPGVEFAQRVSSLQFDDPDAALAREAAQHALTYAFRDRRKRKQQFRALWIARINAAAREHGMSYSRFMNGLKRAAVAVDRKVLADIAVRDPETFRRFAERAREAAA